MFDSIRPTNFPSPVSSVPGETPRALPRRARLALAVLVACLGFAALGPGSAGAQEGSNPGECTDGIDNDGDGRIDRHGSPTYGGPDGIFGPGEFPYDNDCRVEFRFGDASACSDGIDNDDDGQTDGSDTDCTFEYICDDLVDNDLDGSTDGADLDCGCLEDVYGALNCVAEDIEVVLTGLGTQTDGCVNGSDTVSVFLRTLVGTTANNRYDIQIFTALSGAQAETGTCSRMVLSPVVANTSINPSLAQLLNGSGEFRNSDGDDTCGDVTKDDNITTLPGGGDDPDASFDFPFPVTLTCDDVFGGADGLLDVPTCATYDQNATGVCNTPADITDVTSPKCRCDPATASDVPVPDLQCGVPSGVQPNDLISPIGVIDCVDNGDGTDNNPGGNDVLGQNETATCTVRYRNSGICTPTPGPYLTADAERFQCATVGFVQFDINYDTTRGTVIDTLADPLTVDDDDSGTDQLFNDTTNGVLRWTPVSDTGLANGRGIVRPNGDAGTLTFTYQAGAAITGVQNIGFDLETYWSNAQTTAADQSFTTRVLQETVACTASLTTTPITLGHFRAEDEGGRTEIRWTTATEAGNVGFNLYGKVNGSWVKLNADVIPSESIGATTPTDYRFAVSDVKAAEFRLEEIDVRGGTKQHGSFRVGRSYGEQTEVRAIDWSAVRSELDVADRGHGLVRMASHAKTKPAGDVGSPNGLGPVDLLVSGTGIHRVSYETLLSQGFDFAKVQSIDLALSSGGAQVPIRVVAGKFFGPGSYFEFWGEAVDTIYTDTNVYRLEVAKKVGLRVAVDGTGPGTGAALAAYQDTVKVATNAVYSLLAPGSDPFVIREMQAFSSPKTYNFSFAVDELVAGAGPETLHVDLWGATDYGGTSDHHVRVLLNGVQVADEVFDGASRKQIDVSVEGLLVEGTNALTIVQPADTGLPTDIIVLESFGATYPRSPVARNGGLRFAGTASLVEVGGLPSSSGVVYRLGAGGPVHLAGATFAPDGNGGFAARFAGDPAGASYAVADLSAIRQPGVASSVVAGDLLGGEARYLAITHAAFEDHLGTLLSARQSQGYTVDVVTVGEIYAAYSHGVTDARAIRSYIADAARLRGTELVLLVGGDTFDYRNFLGSGSVSFVPSLYAATGDFVRHAPVDPLYADVDGDGVQDLGIGRFPVRTVQELGYIIDKTLTYEAKTYGNVASFAADRFDNAGNISFEVESDQFLQGLSGEWTTSKAYLAKFPTAADARAALVASINAGAALTGYFGHSGPSAWTFSGLFRNVDAINLTNVGSPTVVMQWGCWNTYHVQPQFNTLGHNWLVAGYQGAAAVLGSSTLVEDSHARALAAFLAPLIAEPGLPIGLAMAEAKHQLAARRGGVEDVQLGWSLLGDPALVVTP
jgi:hypothetical protein